MKMGGRMFPAPTQLLPEVGAGTDGSQVLESLAKAIGGCLPDPSAKLVTTAETWVHKQYRQATRNLLVGLANCLQQVMPGNFKMNMFKPENILVPCGSNARKMLLPVEVEMLTQGKASDKALHFIWSGDGDEIVRKIDFYWDPCSFYRLTFAGDEGTDVLWFKPSEHFARGPTG